MGPEPDAEESQINQDTQVGSQAVQDHRLGKNYAESPWKTPSFGQQKRQRRRKLSTPALVDKTDYARVMENLPFSH